MAKRGTPEWVENVKTGTKAKAVKGEDHGSAVLTEEEVREMRAAWEAAPRYDSGRVVRGFMRDLAEQYGISYSTCIHAVYGRTWSHL